MKINILQCFSSASPAEVWQNVPLLSLDLFFLDAVYSVNILNIVNIWAATTALATLIVVKKNFKNDYFKNSFRVQTSGGFSPFRMICICWVMICWVMFFLPTPNCVEGDSLLSLLVSFSIKPLKLQVGGIKPRQLSANSKNNPRKKVSQQKVTPKDIQNWYSLPVVPVTVVEAGDAAAVKEFKAKYKNMAGVYFIVHKETQAVLVGSTIRLQRRPF